MTRRALHALGLTPVVYDADEIERDPFALVRRVIDDLSREADDEAHACLEAGKWPALNRGAADEILHM